jgi:flagellar basal-body rod protein FlgF
MENALLIGLSRQAALTRQLDVIANNLANARTAGYKNEQLIFQEYLMPTASVEDLQGTDQNLSYVIDAGLNRDFSQGGLTRTDNPFDLAINGEGWFVVQTAQGERYTRAGEFSLNPQGQLVTQQGDQVLGEGGPIVFGSSETAITIASDGTISSSAGQKGRLRIVDFEQQDLLQKQGGNLYRTDQTPQPAALATVTQGAVEGSNVVAVKEIASMIDVTRAYVTTAKMIERTEQLRRDAMERLASVPQ